MISQIIDFDESKELHRLVVKPGVSEELDEKKRTYEGLGDFLVSIIWSHLIFKTRVAREEMESIPSDLAPEMHMVYYPQIGCQIALPLQENVSLESQVDIPGLSYQVRDNLILRFTHHSFTRPIKSTLRTRERTSWTSTSETFTMTSLIWKVRFFILLKESFHHSSIGKCNYFSFLTEKIIEFSDILCRVTSISAELDWYFLSFILKASVIAMALAAKEGNYNRPELSDTNILQIERGRNPLQEICVTTFIPNDTKWFSFSLTSDWALAKMESFNW